MLKLTTENKRYFLFGVMSLNKQGNMKKIVLVVVGVLVLLVAVSGCGYNGLVKMDEDVKTKWAQVETQYQRRSDLIPNLVSTVKGAAKFEQTTLTQVIEARSKASQITIDPDKLTEENMQKYQAAQGQLSQALGKLMVLTENYPELKATQQFSELSAHWWDPQGELKTLHEINPYHIARCG